MSKKPRKKNPLPAFDAAEDLYEQLNKVGGRLFTLEEIRNFVDYCMLALQSCPEAARRWVDSSWSKSRIVADERVYTQRIELSDGKVNALIETHHDFFPSNQRAQVDLESLWGNEFTGVYPRAEERQLLVEFAMALHDDWFDKHYGTGATRNTGPEQENEHYALWVNHFSSPEAIEKWCAEHKPARARMSITFYYHRAHSKSSAAPFDVVVFGGRGGASKPAIRVDLLVSYSHLIEKLCTLADELEEAGWQPEALSYDARGKLCTWLFMDAVHPAMER